MAKRKKEAKPAETVADRLQQIYNLHGKLTPDIVIDEAKDPESILHGHFDWDVDAAALEHWRNQARRLISSVRVVFTTDTTAVACVAYVRDPSAPSDEQGYVQVNQVRTDTDRSREVLVSEFSRAAAVLTRAKEIAAVFGMENEVEELIGRVHDTRQRVPTEARA